jgi:hypothetical protein
MPRLSILFATAIESSPGLAVTGRGVIRAVMAVCELRNDQVLAATSLSGAFSRNVQLNKGQGAARPRVS